MEITLLAIVVILILIDILLNLINRSRKSSDPEIKSKIELFTGNLSRLESNLKEDFRLNREENATLNRDNRAELGISLKEFTLELRGKFDELKAEQKELGAKTLESLEKITAKVEQKLDVLANRL